MGNRELIEKLREAIPEIKLEKDMAQEIFDELFNKKDMSELEKKILKLCGDIMQTNGFLVDYLMPDSKDAMPDWTEKELEEGIAQAKQLGRNRAIIDVSFCTKENLAFITKWVEEHGYKTKKVDIDAVNIQW